MGERGPQYHELERLGLKPGELDFSKIDSNISVPTGNQRPPTPLDEDAQSEDRGLDPLWWILSLAGVGVLAWFPQSLAYRQWGKSSWIFVFMATLALLIGTSIGRLLLRAARRARARAASTEAWEPKPLTPGQRRLLLIVVVAGVGFLGVLWPRTAAAQDSSWSWVPVVFGALLGVGFIRWLTSAPPAKAADDGPSRPAFQWPSWTRWAVLGVLVLLGLGVGIAPVVLRASKSLEFLLTGGGFVVGVGMAGWLALQFDRLSRRDR